MDTQEHGKCSVLMVAATPFFSDRGCHIRICNEIKHLQKKGIEVTLCTYHNGQDVPGIRTKRIGSVPWYTKVTPGASWGKIYLDLLLFSKTCQEIGRKGPTILHAHLYEGLAIAWMAKKFTASKAPIVFDCQGGLAQEMYDYHLKKHALLKPFYYVFSALERMLLTLPDEIICSSHKSASYLANTYGTSEKIVSVVEDGFDKDLFYPLERGAGGDREKRALRARLGIDADAFVELYTGSLAEAKGIRVFLDDIPRRLDENSRLVFLIVGYGELEDEYRKKHQGQIDRGRVVFVGRVSYFTLRDYIVVADQAIDPKESLTEGSGKLVHYNACGIPAFGPRMRPLSDTPTIPWDVQAEKIIDTYRSSRRTNTFAKRSE